MQFKHLLWEMYSFLILMFGSRLWLPKHVSGQEEGETVILGG